MIENKKIAIIGSGPAGLTAGIYTSRASLDTTIYLGKEPGGQLTTTTVIENYPGFPEGIDGPELMSNMRKQAERFGCKTDLSTVKSIEKKGEHQFIVTTTENVSAEYHSVIIASGASAKYLGIEGEQKYIGKGYHSCATCDGFFYKDKIIVVAGGGDTAAEESLFLTKFGSKVIVIHRRDQLRASKIMQQRMHDNPKIEIMFNTEIVGFHGDPFVDEIVIKDVVSGEEKNLKVDGVFVAIGHTPNNEFVRDMITMDEIGYLIPQSRFPEDKRTSKYGTMSNIDGIFLAGDIEDKYYRQAITAAGDGCKAAIDCEKWFEDIE